MKPGTIVVCLPINNIEKKLNIKWLPKMDEKTPYMIRESLTDDSGYPGVYFEEGVIGHNDGGTELAFSAKHVREILPSGEIPEEIKEVIEQENLVTK